MPAPELYVFPSFHSSFAAFYQVREKPNRSSSKERHPLLWDNKDIQIFSEIDISHEPRPCIEVLCKDIGSFLSLMMPTFCSSQILSIPFSSAIPAVRAPSFRISHQGHTAPTSPQKKRTTKHMDNKIAFQTQHRVVDVPAFDRMNDRVMSFGLIIIDNTNVPESAVQARSDGF